MTWPSREPVDRLGRHWGWVLAHGILTFLAGVLAFPGLTPLGPAVIPGQLAARLRHPRDDRGLQAPRPRQRLTRQPAAKAPHALVATVTRRAAIGRIRHISHMKLWRPPEYARASLIAT